MHNLGMYNLNCGDSTQLPLGIANIQVGGKWLWLSW